MTSLVIFLIVVTKYLRKCKLRFYFVLQFKGMWSTMEGLNRALHPLVTSAVRKSGQDAAVLPRFITSDSLPPSFKVPQHQAGDGSVKSLLWLLFQRSWVEFLATTWWPTTICNVIWCPFLACRCACREHSFHSKSLKSKPAEEQYQNIWKMWRVNIHGDASCIYPMNSKMLEQAPPKFKNFCVWSCKWTDVQCYTEHMWRSESSTAVGLAVHVEIRFLLPTTAYLMELASMLQESSASVLG